MKKYSNKNSRRKKDEKQTCFGVVANKFTLKITYSIKNCNPCSTYIYMVVAGLVKRQLHILVAAVDSVDKTPSFWRS